MNLLSVSTRIVAAAAIATALSSTASAQIELTTNGDFETGDTTGWTDFTAAPASFIASPDASSGSFGGLLNNPTPGSGAVIKQANIGVGIVNPGDVITIQFDAKGDAGVGGVHFAEFFSELSGGGTSSAEILGSAPLFPPPLSSAFQTYTFTATAGADVSGGVTLQFNAATGAIDGSFSTLAIDNVSVSVIPEPTSAALIGLSGLGLLARRRCRRQA